MTTEEALACVARESARSSQAMVADAIGVSAATVTRWKTGTPPRGLPLQRLLAWAETLPRERAPLAVPTSPLGADPVAEIVRTGQAEAAAWVLEFAARLLEAGAAQLRHGVRREAIIAAVERTEADLTRPKAAPRQRASAG